jgi:hypothetical protein
LPRSGDSLLSQLSGPSLGLLRLRLGSLDRSLVLPDRSGSLSTLGLGGPQVALERRCLLLEFDSLRLDVDDLGLHLLELRQQVTVLTLKRLKALSERLMLAVKGLALAFRLLQSGERLIERFLKGSRR